jgi:hypothetical protein
VDQTPQPGESSSAVAVAFALDRARSPRGGAVDREREGARRETISAMTIDASVRKIFSVAWRAVYYG